MLSENSVRLQLQEARNKVEGGDPVAALQAVLKVLSVLNPQAVAPALQQAQQALLMQSGQAPASATAELNALFQRFSLQAEQCLPAVPFGEGADRSGAEPMLDEPDIAREEQSSCMPTWAALAESKTNGPGVHPSTSILQETGRIGVAEDAALDGSSFVCDRCGGLVSAARRDAHAAWWCSSAG
ncbi:hypothetical protein WJX72_005057 [[Myrmecia] bisecta]|uniref:C2HC zinc finger plants domain-containing protein n=1 Tax=[Myrmecia] bisecta TaxID=41462 RepID=A0AAW1PK74_9CHLO